MCVHPGWFPPEIFAGTELAMHELCRALVANRHELVVVAKTGATSGPLARIDQLCGYPVVRARLLIDAQVQTAARFRPDVIVATHAGDWMHHLLPVIGDVPLVVYEHEVSRSLDGAPAAITTGALFAANSEVTAAHLMRRYSIASTVIRPLFGVDRYADLRPKGNKVLFVSLQPSKGADVAIRIAQARPNAQFIFVESWTRDIEATRQLRLQVADIANITLLANQPGLGGVLPNVKLLLMSSRGDESWGRTATEAQICGIPVLGSRRGNLKTTIGPGGMTLDPDDPIERWLDAFDAIMNDPAVHQDLSRKALEHAALFRQEIEREYRAFEGLLSDAIARRQV